MNDVMVFFIGVVTFVSVMLLKIPVKQFTESMASEKSYDMVEYKMLRKRYNILIFFMVVIVAFSIYCFLLYGLGDSYFKLCCSVKAMAVSIALYSVYEQWFGMSKE